jgi:hypothetical protein
VTEYIQNQNKQTCGVGSGRLARLDRTDDVVRSSNAPVDDVDDDGVVDDASGAVVVVDVVALAFDAAAANELVLAAFDDDFM